MFLMDTCYSVFNHIMFMAVCVCTLMLQLPSFVFTEDFQVDFLKEYHGVFDEFRKTFLAGEMVWNFADFMTVQSE